MTLLSIIKDVSVQVALPEPTTVNNAAIDSDEFKLVQFSVEAGLEIARRVDWPDLKDQESFTFSQPNETKTFVDLDCARLIQGNAVRLFTGAIVRGSVPEGLFNRRDTLDSGAIRYFILRNQSMQFYPQQGIATGVVVDFQNKNWAVKNGQPATDWNLDSDTAKFRDELIVQGTVWRWKRHKSQAFQDFRAEYDATLTQLAMDETRLTN